MNQELDLGPPQANRQPEGLTGIRAGGPGLRILLPPPGRLGTFDDKLGSGEWPLLLGFPFSRGEAPSLTGRFASVGILKIRSFPPKRAQPTYTADEENQCWREKVAIGQLRGEQNQTGAPVLPCLAPSREPPQSRSSPVHHSPAKPSSTMAVHPGMRSFFRSIPDIRERE